MRKNPGRPATYAAVQAGRSGATDQEILTRTGVDASLLVLGLTEDLAVKNMKGAGAKMHELKAMGVGVGVGLMILGRAVLRSRTSSTCR